LAALTLIILFCWNFSQKKNFFFQRTIIICERKWRIFWHIQEYFILRHGIKSSKLINYSTTLYMLKLPHCCCCFKTATWNRCEEHWNQTINKSSNVFPNTSRGWVAHNAAVDHFTTNGHFALIDHLALRCAEANNFNNFAKSTPFQSATGAMS